MREREDKEKDLHTYFNKTFETKIFVIRKNENLSARSGVRDLVSRRGCCYRVLLRKEKFAKTF